MPQIVASLIGKVTVVGSIGLLVFSASCAILIYSLSFSPATTALPLDLSMVGQNTALATALLGMVLVLSVRQTTSALIRVLCLIVAGLAGVVLVQWVLKLYPDDGLLRVFLNTVPANGSWPGRMSLVAALAIFLLALSALLLFRASLSALLISGVGTGLATALTLGCFAAHLTGLTLFPSAFPGDGVLSMTTSFLLATTGLAMGYRFLNSPIYLGWQERHPGQGIFIEVMILLGLLCVMALGSVSELVLQGRLVLALGVLLFFFLVGLLVIYQPIVMLVNRSVASADVLRSREEALEQAQSQARLGSWRILLPGLDLEWSRECYRIFGLPPEVPLTFDDFIAAVHPADRDHVRNSWRLALAGAEYDIEHRIVVNREVRWVRERAQLERDADNRLIGGVGTVQDITQLKVKEAQLRESRDQLRKLAAHNDNIREQERARIARELHDEMGQLLTVLRLDVSLLERRIRHDSPELTDMLGNLKQGIDAVIGVMRDVATCLRPLALDAGLVSAVDWLLENLRQRAGMQCELVLKGTDAHLDPGRTTTAFRVLQESLTNVIRHANATKLKVRITITERELLLSVADNGVGFDPASVSAFRRFGLMGMRERVLIYGGTTTIDSEPGRGTTLSAIIPIEQTSSVGEKY